MSERASRRKGGGRAGRQEARADAAPCGALAGIATAFTRGPVRRRGGHAGGEAAHGLDRGEHALAGGAEIVLYVRPQDCFLFNTLTGKRVRKLSGGG